MTSSLSGAVLVVDDAQTVTSAMEVVLRGAGIGSKTALSGNQAIRLLMDEQFGVLLVDKNLPDKSGLEVIAEARRLQPYCACVLMTGSPTYESTLAALRLGAIDYLEKPFPDLNLVVQKVEGLLRQQQVVFERDRFAAALRELRGELKKRDALLQRQQSDIELLQQLIEARVQDRTLELSDRLQRLEEELRAIKTPVAR